MGTFLIKTAIADGLPACATLKAAAGALVVATTGAFTGALAIGFFLLSAEKSLSSSDSSLSLSKPFFPFLAGALPPPEIIESNRIKD